MLKKAIYSELEPDLAREEIQKIEVCTLLNIMPRTLSNKLTGVSRFHEKWFKDIPEVKRHELLV